MRQRPPLLPHRAVRARSTRTRSLPQWQRSGGRCRMRYVTLMQKGRAHCRLHTHARDLPGRLLDRGEAA
eukprot:1994096-Prymnesium_polylepis.1